MYSAKCQSWQQREGHLTWGGAGFLEEMVPKPVQVSPKEGVREGQGQKTYTSSHQQDRATVVPWEKWQCFLPRQIESCQWDQNPRAKRPSLLDPTKTDLSLAFSSFQDCLAFSLSEWIHLIRLQWSLALLGAIWIFTIWSFCVGIRVSLLKCNLIPHLLGNTSPQRPSQGINGQVCIPNTYIILSVMHITDCRELWLPNMEAT